MRAPLFTTKNKKKQPAKKNQQNQQQQQKETLQQFNQQKKNTRKQLNSGFKVTPNLSLEHSAAFYRINLYVNPRILIKYFKHKKEKG